MVRSVTMPALQRLDQDPEDSGALAHGTLAPAEGLAHRLAQHLRSNAELLGDVAPLRQARQAEYQGLEHLRCPVLDHAMGVGMSLRAQGEGDQLKIVMP